MGLRELSSNNKESSQAGYLQRFYFFFGRFNIFDLIVIIICLASLCCSWIESIVNYDSLHWGFFYGPALDLKRGAIPHSGTFIGYGYLTTWIQSISLNVFGERLLSIGIITGLFYSLTLFLSYRVFLRFMSKHLSFIAVGLIFLIHPYIIVPAPNYFVYTFQLLALIFFLRYSERHYNGFLAGLFLCLSVLCRYSSVIAILPPFVILLCWDFFAVQGAKKSAIEKIWIVCCGFFIPLTLFFAYLLMNSALDDFFFQNRMMIELWGKIDNVNTYLNFLAGILQIGDSYASDFRGKLFTLILVICLFILIREGIRKVFDGAVKSAYAHYDIAAVCLVAVFGYLNSVHHYETFRLVNGASLGIGLVVLVFYNLFINTIKPVKYLIIFSGILVFLFLSNSLFLKTTTSSYYPWKTDVLFRNGVTNKTIGIFKGKLLTKEYNDFYQEVFDAIAPFKNTCHILNYTNDSVAFLMNDLPRVQLASIYYPWFEDVYKQVKIIDRNEAVILSYKRLDFPDYTTIFIKKWPEEIPWLGGGYLFIYAPKRYAGDNDNLPDHTDNKKR
ncbi:MAG: glycosyltransferase family 39 protein [Deltaproteobacteria bacterium]|nr:glycosyltransferase family 39 protein [Deltaproteobacteria bacterium]